MSHNLLLKDFKPKTALVTEDHTPSRARFPVIDIHNHLGEWEDDYFFNIYTGGGWTIKDIPATVAMMDEMNICSVNNLDGGWGDQLKRNLARYKEPYPDRFTVFASTDWGEIETPGFGEKWAKELENSVRAGAQGMKVFKTLGLNYREKSGNLIKVDDPRCDPVWAAAGELGIPIVIHSSDPVAFFWPLDSTNERWDELVEHPDWHFYGKDYPPFIEPIEAQLRVVARHPRTNFISAHVLSYSENLRWVAAALDKYPNLYVDIGERIGELGRQPYTSRWFLTKYADRVLFGTDVPCNRPTYEIYFRCLETKDEYFDYGQMQGRYQVYGLYLSDDVLQKIYSINACKLVPGLEISFNKIAKDLI
jgi:predicted TIM-barrel fold metal-dependent hydrolase